MTEPAAPRLAETYAEVEDALLSRWPETRLEPSLDRIRAFTELLGDPQRAYPVDPPDRHQRQDLHVADDRHPAARARAAHRPVHQPARRADERADLHRRRAAHDEAFVRAFNDVAPYTHLVDADRAPPAVVLRDRRRDGVRRVRRRAGRRRRGRGRAWAASWDATNVADAAVAVVLPVAVDHAALPRRHARRDRRREGRDHQARRDRGARRSSRPRSPRCCSRRAAEVGATVAREGLEFGVVSRVPGGRRPDR